MSMRGRAMTKSQMDGVLRMDVSMQNVWRSLDLDGNGHLDIHEARLQGISPEEFRKMDKDGNGFVTITEFKEYYEKTKRS
jgi:hypothetical protein